MTETIAAEELARVQIDMLCKDLSKVDMARVIVAGRGIIAEREKALLSAAARVGVLEEENARLRGEVDRFMQPSNRNLSTRDEILPLTTFKRQHLRGLALLFRQWDRAELWGRPNEAELAARQVETAFAQIEALQAACRPFAAALGECGDDEGQKDDWNVWEHVLAMNVTVGDFRRARSALASIEVGGEVSA